MATKYKTYQIVALDGGMIRAFSPRLLDQTKGYSHLFQNFSMENPGMPKKRPAIRFVQGVPEGVNGVHYFNKLSTGTSYTLASYNGNLARLNAGSWTNIKTGLNASASMEFLTIADQIIATNGVDPMMVWDGITLTDDIGGEKASMRTFLLYEHNDLRWTAKTAGTAGNHIRIRYIKVDLVTDTAYVDVTGTGTEDDPYFITAYVAWELEGAAEFQRITTTAANIITLVQAHGTANTLVDVEHVAGSDGSKHVMELPEQPLVGGHDTVYGSMVVEYRLRAVLAGDPNNPSLLRISHTGDPHLWSPYKTGSNAVEAFVSPDDGEGITGLLNMGDGGVLIGKPHALYGLFGYKRENFVIDMIDPNIGVSSHRSMAYARPYAYWVGPEGVYRAQPGGVPQDIMEPIRHIWNDLVDKDRLDEAVGFVHKQHYVVSLPLLAGNWILLVLNIQRERWGIWDKPQGLLDYMRVNEDLLGRTHVLLASGIHRLQEEQFYDNVGEVSTLIVPELETLELDMGDPTVEKDFGDMYLVVNTTSAEDIIRMKLYFDWEEEPSINLSKVCTPVQKNRQLVIRVPIGKTARFVRIHISHEGITQFTPMSVYFTYMLKEVL